MKTIIVTLSIILISLTASARENERTVDFSGFNIGAQVRTVCISGYLFAVAKSKNAISITQIFRINKYGTDRNTHPIKCKK